MLLSRLLLWLPARRGGSAARVTQAKLERAALVVTSCSALASCHEPLQRTECDQLLDHYTEKLVRSENPRVAPHVVVEKQRLAKDLARREPMFEYDRCNEDVSRSQYDCAMAASDVDSIERCLTR